MSSRPLGLARRPAMLSALVAALLFSLFVASPAAASPETIKRSMSNILFGPLDFVLSPVTGSRAVYYNIQDIDDTNGVRAAYALPGVGWNIAMMAAGGSLRLFTGLLEFIPGLILIPFEADMDPLFAPPERADALVDEQYDFLSVKFGVNYVD